MHVISKLGEVLKPNEPFLPRTLISHALTGPLLMYDDDDDEVCKMTKC